MFLNTYFIALYNISVTEQYYIELCLIIIIIIVRRAISVRLTLGLSVITFNLTLSYTYLCIHRTQVSKIDNALYSTSYLQNSGYNIPTLPNWLATSCYISQKYTEVERKNLLKTSVCQALIKTTPNQQENLPIKSHPTSDVPYSPNTLRKRTV